MVSTIVKLIPWQSIENKLCLHYAYKLRIYLLDRMLQHLSAWHTGKVLSVDVDVANETTSLVDFFNVNLNLDDVNKNFVMYFSLTLSQQTSCWKVRDLVYSVASSAKGSFSPSLGARGTWMPVWLGINANARNRQQSTNMRLDLYSTSDRITYPPFVN